MAKRLTPTWHGIAIALLKNDVNLISLGFSPPSSKLEQLLVSEKKKASNPQLELRL